MEFRNSSLKKENISYLNEGKNKLEQCSGKKFRTIDLKFLCMLRSTCIQKRLTVLMTVLIIIKFVVFPSNFESHSSTAFA